jgi:hypothetical protein
VFTAISLPGDNVDSSTRDINLYISKNGVALTADFFMTVTLSSRATVVDSQVVRLETTDGVSYKVWNIAVTMRDSSYTCSGTSCNDQYSYERSVIQGNTSTQAASVYAHFNHPDLTGASTVAAKKALVTDTSAATAAVASFDFSANEPSTGQSIEKSGCLSFSTLTDPATGSYCTGVGANLSAASSAPLSDTAGSFTVNWVKTTLPTKMFYAN